MLANQPRSVFDEDGRTDEERLYFGMIDRAIEAREYNIISNGKPAHAVYLIHKLLTAARGEVRVLCGKLARRLNGVLAYADPHVCAAAVGLLARGCRLEVLVADDIDVEPGAAYGSHPLLAAISEARLVDHVTVARPRNLVTEEWPFHFLLVDKTALRIETNVEEAEALVNFNDPETGTKLDRLFTTFMEDAQPFDWSSSRPAVIS